MNRRHFLIASGVAIVAAVTGAFFANRRTALQSASQDAVKALFDREWFSPDQKPISTQDWKNKVLVVNFWASWCPPCVEEMPLIDAFFRQNESKGWQVVGLAIDQPSRVRQFLNQFPVAYAIGLAGLNGTELGKILGNDVGGLPFTVVLNAKGDLIQRHLGKLSPKDIDKWVV